MSAPAPSPAAVPATGVAVVPGPDWSLTFVQRADGPRAGHWLLPGAQAAEGEPPEQAARRGADEAGLHVGALAPIAIYEVRGSDGGSDYHEWLHVYRSLHPCPMDPDAHAEGAEVEQVHPRDLLPHPTDMRILCDAELADYDPVLIRRLLSADGVLIRRVDGD
ncbi:NUDIX hydrolase [Nocardiopsis coralliicola]